MTVQNFWLDPLLMASVSSTSSFWGGLSGSFSTTNSGSQAIQGWSFQFVSKYNNFDFYNADESAAANNDGTYTITVRAAAAAAPLGAGASLALGFAAVNPTRSPQLRVPVRKAISSAESQGALAVSRARSSLVMLLIIPVLRFTQPQ